MNQETTRPDTTKVARDLTRTDFVAHDNGAVLRVDAVQPYRNGDGTSMVALLLTPIGTGEPVHWKRPAAARMALASDEQVAAAGEERHRAEVAQALHELARLIVQGKVRLNMWPGLAIHAGLPDGEIERVAEQLGVKMSPYGTKAMQIHKTLGEGYGPGITVTFYGDPAPPAPDPVDAPEVVPAEPGGDADQVATEALAFGDPGDDLWFFVFGPNSEHYGRYLCLHGSEESTRWRVAEVFGEGATDQYARVDARVDHLLVMPEVEWPTVARPGE